MKWNPPSVGAMKIARNVAVSGRYNEWYSPTPAPSLRELSSECETEGVSSDGPTGPIIYPPAIINSEIFERLRSSGYTPSVSPSGCQLPQRGSRKGFFHSTGYLRNHGVSGDFHRPYETQKILHFTVQPGGMGKCLHNSHKKVDIITGKQEKIDFFVAICYNNTNR